MKKNVLKTMVAAVCVVAAGVGGMKAYNNQSEVNVLLAENVEALSKHVKLLDSDDICFMLPTERCKWNQENVLIPGYGRW